MCKLFSKGKTMIVYSHALLFLFARCENFYLKFQFQCRKMSKGKGNQFLVESGGPKVVVPYSEQNDKKK